MFSAAQLPDAGKFHRHGSEKCAPMRYGIVSDVHANLPALEAVFEALRRAGVEKVLCAGDIVGYGANPNECIEFLADRQVDCIAGNHDLMAVGRLADERAIRLARQTLQWTRMVLTQRSRDFLGRLPINAQVGDQFVLAHGSLDDSQEYVSGPRRATVELKRMARAFPTAEWLILGHTHRPEAFQLDARAPHTTRRGAIQLPPKSRWLLNPGSVGQSRSWSVRANYLVVDTVAATARFGQVRYDVLRCRRDLQRAGLPMHAYHLPPWRTHPRLGRLRRLGRRLFR